ncbi:MAG: CHAD domain-containing protein [Gammaproteobacteria bacterium]|nr:MAG: CHAD domain-containing protein [Gammaproteobacteria bacterium]
MRKTIDQPALCLDVPKTCQLDELIKTLEPKNRWGEVQSRNGRVTWLDTFDWRLFGAGYVLEAIQYTNDTVLVWRNLGYDKILARTLIKNIPKSHADLTASGGFRQLQKIVNPRALLPVLNAELNLKRISLLNDSNQPAVIIDLFKLSVKDGRKGIAIRPGLLVSCTHGNVKMFMTVANQLEERDDFDIRLIDPIIEGLAHIKRRPLDYTNNCQLQISPLAHADSACKQILRRLMEVIETNINGIKRDIDSEFLHDFRVAIRRSRALLTQIKHIYPPDAVKRYRDAFSELAQSSNELRDLDVHLLEFSNYESYIPANKRDALGPLKVYLKKKRIEAFKDLGITLNSKDILRLLKSWQVFLDVDPPEYSTLKNAKRPIIEIASNQIWKLSQRFIHDCSLIQADSPGPALHTLRITGKKLRYVLEFFRYLYPGEQIGPFISDMKDFQNYLGEFQDLNVQQLSMANFEQALIEQGNVKPVTINAIELLREGLHDRQTRIRSEFPAYYKRFYKRFGKKRMRKVLGVGNT